MSASQRRLHSLWLMSVVLGTMAVAACGPLGGEGPSDGTAARFDSAKWKAESAVADRGRLTMYQDLTRSGRLLAMDRAGVIELLGDPNEVGALDQREIWEYRLGPEPGAPSVDSLWLQLEFDDGRVAIQRVVTD